jgi:predicted alpha/beta-fold hydrolase
MRRKARAFPDAFDLEGLWGIWSIRAFDERYTAPHHGFDGATDYYHRASAMRIVAQVARPALVLSAADDPFVPADIFGAAPLVENPHITTVVSPAGGHCGFVETPNGDDGYYAERTAIDFLAQHLR